MRDMIKILVLASLLLLSACSAQYAVAQQNPAAGFTFRHSDFDYKVAWKTTESHNEVFIYGILKNIRYPYIDSIELTVFLLGTDGTVRARATTIPFPQQTRANDVVSFNARLQNVTLNKGDTFTFVIHYKGTEGGMDGGIDWNSTFVVDAMTGAGEQKEIPESEKW